jgi:hypothetical protein
MLDVVLFDFIDVQCIAAGGLGGLMHAWSLEKASAWEVVKYIAIGAITANFIAPQLFRILTVFPVFFLAFGVGYTGKHQCLMLEKFFNKLDVLGKIKNE